MSFLAFEAKNEIENEYNISIERMIDLKDKIIYSDHRGIIFAIYKEDAFEDKIQSAFQAERS